jgi:N-acetylglucosamine kinase-like BadF-type ATPase
MEKTGLVFGADGGGTKTLGLIADGAGKILARRQVGASNPNVVGVETSAKHLLDLIAGCCEEAGCAPAQLEGIVCGLAGVGSAAIRQSLEEALRTESARRGAQGLSVTLETDARIALEGALDGGAGAIIIAGTGSIVLAKTPAGETVRVGGLGKILGDEGSGYHVGLEALKAVARDMDGRGKAPALRRAIQQRCGWETRDALVAAVYKEQYPIPSLAPLVLDLARQSDPVALAILEDAAAQLTLHLAPLAAAWPEGSPLEAAFVGGLIEHDTPYADILRRRIRHDVPRVTVVPQKHPPAMGALILARRARGKTSA